jgi:hypothetical protein
MHAIELTRQARIEGGIDDDHPPLRRVQGQALERLQQQLRCAVVDDDHLELASHASAWHVVVHDSHAPPIRSAARLP